MRFAVLGSGSQGNGTLIASAFFQTPAFVTDFEAARAELRQVLGYPAQLPDESKGHTAANPLQ